MFKAMSKVEFGFSPGYVRSFLEYEKQRKRLPNRNVITVNICIALHMPKNERMLHYV